MTVVSPTTVIVAINRCGTKNSSFDDDHSPTVVKGKNYASFADWLPVDDSQLFCCTTLIGSDCKPRLSPGFVDQKMTSKEVALLSDAEVVQDDMFETF
ncbi:hypothetical protein T01_13861 [Trichinella spiralis]|uniref:Uncharacterized protein n=1 Tax=Trichinella spiralis TaxID=6334 RepID=A0A0V1B1Z0_TRISP|nr:hypothetical protein T01_13861 [Trichinella spiralis]